MTLTRRGFVAGTLGAAAAVPLAALPFSQDSEEIQSPSMVESTPDANEDIDYLGEYLGVINDTLAKAVYMIERHRLEKLPEGSLVFRSDSPDREVALDAIRRWRRQQDSWDAPRRVMARMEQFAYLPEPARAIIMPYVEDAYHAFAIGHADAMGDVVFMFVEDHVGLGDDEGNHTPEEVEFALSQPTTVGAVLLRLSDQLGIEPSSWLNDADLETLKRTA